MKNLIFKSLFLVALLFVVSCVKQELPVEDKVADERVIFRSVEQIDQLHLDKKFDIPADIYQRFLDRTVFFDNELSGLEHAGIERILNNQQSEEFWANFGFSIRNSSRTLILKDPVRIYVNKYPVRGGCAPLPGNTCFGHANDILDQKRIIGGCEAKPNWVCFVPSDEDGGGGDDGN